MVEVTLPQLGETVTEGTIIRWIKQPGEEVSIGDPLYEISTDKVDSEVPSPAAGVVSKLVAEEGQLVVVGEVLAVISQSAPSVGMPQAAPEVAADAPSPAAAERSGSVAPREPTEGRHRAPSNAAATGESRLMSPLVRSLVSDHGLDLSDIAGSGKGGRITRADVERLIRGRQQGDSAEPKKAEEAEPPPLGRVEQEVVPLSRIRRSIGAHMVSSKATSPHVLTAMEVDFEAVERVRQAARGEWRAQEGFSLTYLPFIVRAVCDTLREFPHLNASIDGKDLIVHRSVNLAVAVDLDFQGLIAPVLHNSESMRLRAIARGISELAARARRRNLTAGDVSGGTFTITNPGQYGTLMQFPIINQPQVAILSTDGISRKPVVVTAPDGSESIGIHSVGVMALAWDHRAFDGAYAAAFLKRLRGVIGTRDWEAEL